MGLQPREIVGISYFVLAIAEVVLYGLSGLLGVYMIALAAALAATGQAVRRGYWWASTLVWASSLVLFVFGAVAAYASFSLGTASLPFGLIMVVLTIASLVLPVYAALNWKNLVSSKMQA